MTEVRVVKLRPCPFCQAFGKEFLHIETLEDDDGGLAYAVVCNSCGAMGPAIEDVRNAREAAIETCVVFWNGAKNGSSETDTERESVDSGSNQ